MTNAEKIKNMSVEELANFFKKSTNSLALRLGGEYVCNEIPTLVEWLESEAKDDADIH